MDENTKSNFKSKVTLSIANDNGASFKELANSLEAAKV